MIKITYENMCEMLPELLPELRGKYEASIKSWREDVKYVPGPHVVYGEVLNPYLESLLQADIESESLRRVFDSLETLANNSDERVVDVVNSTVLEYLLNRTEWVVQSEKFMGPKVRRMMESKREWWKPSEER